MYVSKAAFQKEIWPKVTFIYFVCVFEHELFDVNSKQNLGFSLLGIFFQIPYIWESFGKSKKFFL